MRRLVRRPGWALSAVGLVLLFERPVHAYLDPGSGSLIYQALLAALLGAGFTFRRFLGAVTQLGRRRSTTSTAAAAASTDGRAGQPRG